MRTMVLVYKKLQNWVINCSGFYVGIHIPAPWSIWSGLTTISIDISIVSWEIINRTLTERIRIYKWVITWGDN